MLSSQSPLGTQLSGVSSHPCAPGNVQAGRFQLGSNFHQSSAGTFAASSSASDPNSCARGGMGRHENLEADALARTRAALYFG